MKNNVKHTKGPWIEITDNENYDIIGKDGTMICSINTSLVKEKWEANARLIASAPELLEACKDALADWTQDRYMDENTLAHLRNAISKAQGGA